MSFEKQLERLTNAINRKKGAALGREVVVETQDLRELIFQFNRVDKELREHKQNFKQKEFEYRTQCQDVVSAARIEADDMPDKLAELEKAILHYLLDKDYPANSGDWGFEIVIGTKYKQKNISIILYNFVDGKKEIEEIFKNWESSSTTKEMWDKAIKHFTLNAEPLQEDTKLELDDTNQSAIYKIAGYESEGRE